MVPVYRTILPTVALDRLVGQLGAGEIDVISFTSSSTVRNFVGLFPRRMVLRLIETTIACIGPYHGGHRPGSQPDGACDGGGEHHSCAGGGYRSGMLSISVIAGPPRRIDDRGKLIGKMLRYLTGRMPHGSSEIVYGSERQVSSLWSAMWMCARRAASCGILQHRQLVRHQRKDVIGIITDTDMVRRVVATGADMTKTTVEQIMSAPLVTIEEHKTLLDANDLMAQTHLRHLG